MKCQVAHQKLVRTLQYVRFTLYIKIVTPVLAVEFPAFLHSWPHTTFSIHHSLNYEYEYKYQVPYQEGVDHVGGRRERSRGWRG